MPLAQDEGTAALCETAPPADGDQSPDEYDQDRTGCFHGSAQRNAEFESAGRRCFRHGSSESGRAGTFVQRGSRGRRRGWQRQGGNRRYGVGRNRATKFLDPRSGQHRSGHDRRRADSRCADLRSAGKSCAGDVISDACRSAGRFRTRRDGEHLREDFRFARGCPRDRDSGFYGASDRDIILADFNSDGSGNSTTGAQAATDKSDPTPNPPARKRRGYTRLFPSKSGRLPPANNCSTPVLRVR